MATHIEQRINATFTGKRKGFKKGVEYILFWQYCSSEVGGDGKHKNFIHNENGDRIYYDSIDRLKEEFTIESII